MYDFRAKYKESIELDEDQFTTLCKFQVATEDKKAIKMILEHLQPKVIAQPSTLRPPMPPIVITKTVTTTTRIERIPKNKQSFADCVKEMRASMEKGEKLTIGKYDDSELGIKSKEEIHLILDANEMVLARD